MKRKITFLMLYILLAPVVLAQEEIMPHVEPEIIDAGVLPDSPTWSLDVLFEKLQIMFTADKTKKIELRLRNIEERVEEIKIMANKNKLKAIEYATEEKEKQEGKILEEVEKLPINIKSKVLGNLQKHISVLERVREKFPEHCPTDIPCISKGIDTAIEKGERNIERFRERIMPVIEKPEPTDLVCCKITPMVAPEYRESATSYTWKTKSDCSVIRNGRPIVGVGYQIVDNNFCKKLYEVLPTI